MIEMRLISKPFFILAESTLYLWSQFEPEICTVENILRYGKLFRDFVVFGGYKR